MWVVKKGKNPKFLWPEALAHRNMYGGTKRGESHKTKSKRRQDDGGLARDLPVFVRMDGGVLDKEGLGCKSISRQAKREELCRRKDHTKG